METPLDKEIAETETRLAELKQERDVLLGQTRLYCVVCKTSHPINKYRYLQTHWYVEPHGCSGGDYWKQGDGECQCPCGQVLRLYKLPEVMALKYVFGSREDTHNTTYKAPHARLDRT